MTNNGTSAVNVIRSGTGWTVDVTPCNLNISTALKDFRVVINGAIIPNVNVTKISATVIQYTGTPVPPNSTVNVVRQTPIDRIAPLVGYGSRLSTVSYEGELNTIHRILAEDELRLLAVELGNPISGSNLLDTPYGASWDGDTAFGATRNALYDKIETLTPKTGGRVSDFAYVNTGAQPPDSDNTLAMASTAWTRTRITNAINDWSSGAPTVATPPHGFNTRVVNTSYVHTFVMPAGVVVPFAGNPPASGWLFCNGQAVSRTTFSRLFAAIGTTYGAGDGTTTFNVPNLATDNRTIGCTTGTTAFNAQAGAVTVPVPLPQHQHSVSLTTSTQSANHTHTPQSGFTTFFGTRTGGVGGSFNLQSSAGAFHGEFGATNTESTPHTHTVSGNTANAGTADATIDVRQPTLYMPFFISTGGQ